GLNPRASDFMPNKQTLLPVMTRRDLGIRAVLSFQWIFTSYFVLTAIHDLFAVFFVGLLQMDLPGEWPAIYGSITEAYSLRRFWGVFWHQLHVPTFEAYMPPVVRGRKRGQHHLPCQTTEATRKALRAFWIFSLSAICHAVLNWATTHKAHFRQELKFFLSNCSLCLVETVV
ncbi:hypothetical protein GQ53DRAFT_593419, partial [Thozetella sp. PMI_491]